MKPVFRYKINIIELGLTRVFILISLLLFNSRAVLGQCVNSPTVTLSSISGSTCGTTPVTVSGNTFGGSATKVAITVDGNGSVSPTSATTSPFVFTYTPKSKDIGKKVIITVTSNNPLGLSCSAAKATYTLTVSTIPAAPAKGTITQPTCDVVKGAVVLNGLPSSGTWTLTGTPEGIAIAGTGTSTTISGISAGTYTFTVTTSMGCTSSASASVVINAQPASPASPTQTVDCLPGFGKAGITVTSPIGTGLQYRLDAGTFQSGTSFTNVANGTHSVTVKNSSGCTTTGISFPVSCGCANQPTVTLGSLSGSTCGTTPVTVSGNTIGGSATSVTITENGVGKVSPTASTTRPFAFTYTPAAGDAGNTVIITVTTNNPLGLPCAAATAIYTLTVNANPSAPLVGTITQPGYELPTGSVVLSGLPESGSWILTCSPGYVTTSGTGITKTITGLTAGTYTYTVTNSFGCTSEASSNIVIYTQSATPTMIISNPAPVCSPATADLTAPEITAGSALNLTFTYWADSAATIPNKTPADATDGTYYIKGTTTAGFFIVKPVMVTVDRIPLANAGPDQVLEFLFGTTMNAELAHDYETGVWSIISGTCVFSDTSYARTSVDNLSVGENKFLWTVTNGVCPASRDTVLVIVHDLIIKTLITPNMDGRNDYFVLRGLSTLGKTELVIFDRRGVQVYNNRNYDNLWNGVDYKGNPLPDDTYFCVIKTGNGKTVNGYIVIRR